jgi:hypothetical protein
MDVDHSQSGWRVESDSVSMFVTERGGHMAPVQFYTNSDSPVQPYYISPWQDEDQQPMPDPILVPLRGDFFCLPFGGNAQPHNGQQFTGHGEVSSSPWSLAEHETKDGITTFTLEMNTTVHKGTVTKKVFLAEGQNAVYTSHVVDGFTESMPMGHHSTLRPPKGDGKLRIQVGQFDKAMTNPVIFSNPVNGEYQCFAINAPVDDLAKVPVQIKDMPPADATTFPLRTGYTDLVQVFKKPAEHPAWTTATNQEEGYLWFSLKDASAMPATIFWISNKGRHGYPWNGRNVCLGLEETRSYFAEGWVPSVEPNSVNDAGFPTTHPFSPDAPTAINFIQGVVKIPEGFEMVKTAQFAPGKVTFTSTTGREVSAEVDHSFLRSGNL